MCKKSFFLASMLCIPSVYILPRKRLEWGKSFNNQTTI